jgi:hypothetical protein
MKTIEDQSTELGTLKIACASFAWCCSINTSKAAKEMGKKNIYQYSIDLILSKVKRL